MNESTVIALGFFDGVHKGHGALLRTVAQVADQVGVYGGSVAFTPYYASAAYAV